MLTWDTHPMHQNFAEKQMVNIANIMSVACQTDVTPVKDLPINFVPDTGRYYGDDEPIMSFRGDTIKRTLRILRM